MSQRYLLSLKPRDDFVYLATHPGFSGGGGFERGDGLGRCDGRINPRFGRGTRLPLGASEKCLEVVILQPPIPCGASYRLSFSINISLLCF